MICDCSLQGSTGSISGYGTEISGCICPWKHFRRGCSRDLSVKLITLGHVSVWAISYFVFAQTEQMKRNNFFSNNLFHFNLDVVRVSGSNFDRGERWKPVVQCLVLNLSIDFRCWSVGALNYD